MTSEEPGMGETSGASILGRIEGQDRPRDVVLALR